MSGVELSTLGSVLAKTLAPFEDAQGAVKTRARNLPPPSPAIGDRYIVASPGAGAWLERSHHIAERTQTGWQFVAPVAGMSAWVTDEATEFIFNGVEWNSTAGGGGQRALVTPHNKRMPVRTTTADGQRACDIADVLTPVAGSRIYVEVNGLKIPELGDGTKVGAACYFSRDAGATALSLLHVIAGDVLYWQESVAGYQLDAATDVIEFVYEVA